MSYSDMTDSDKQRLGAAFFNIKDQKSAMSKDKIDWDSAAKAFKPTGPEITAASFRISISRMKKDWSKLTSTDKQRLAASFFHMNVDYRKSITGTINWAKATKDFKADGKISAASFKISVSHILSNFTPGDGVSMGTPAGRKRTATTASASPAPSVQGTASRKRTKTARAAAAAVAESSNTEAPSEADSDDQGKGEDQADEPSNKPNGEKDTSSEAPKIEPLSDPLGTDDMFGGKDSDESFLSFLPVTQANERSLFQTSD